VKNEELAKIFYQIADFLSMDNQGTFRIIAYRKAAAVLDSLEEDVEKIYNQGGTKKLIEIPGIGKSIALLIEEYLKKGKIRYYQSLKKETPVDLENLTRIEGLGSKTIKTLYQELGVKNIKELEKAARENRISGLFGFGQKKQNKILESLKFLEKNKGRFLLGEILPEAEVLEDRIRSLKTVQKASMAGSLRRRKETIGDVDFLIASLEPKQTIREIFSVLGKVKIIGQGETKVSVKTDKGYNIDLRIVAPESYGSALQYFTGSKEHNIEVRKLAIKKKLKINEYGIFRGQKKIGGATEEELYQIIGLNFIPPEIRENTGETEEFSFNDPLKLVERDDIKGDLHCHSTWSGGANTIEEMAQQAEKLGYSYIGISDHARELRIENGLDEKDLEKQRKEIDKLNLECSSGFKILQGCEVNVLKDGSLDINDQALKKLDYVIIGIHSYFKMPEQEMTQRIIKAMKNPLVNILAHPTGRILSRRSEYQIDFQKIVRAARETKTVLEINGSPQRMDLNDSKIRWAKKEKVKMVINSDAHNMNQMDNIKYGVFQARRGWAEKKDIINSYFWEKSLI
jgi:DNA polymerase (family X)